MIRIWVIFISSLFPVLILSQQQPSEAVSIKDTLLPGTSTSIAFIVTNISSENKNFIIEASTSNSSIIPISSKGKLSISAHKSIPYIVPLQISAETLKGLHSVMIKVTDPLNGSYFTKKTNLFVSANRKLIVTTLDFPEFIRAGETIQATFLVKNSGNTPENLILESKNAVLEHDPDLVMQPGETKIIYIHKNTSSQLDQNEYQNLNLSVYDREDSTEIQSVYVSTKVISIKPTEKDIFHRLPIKASVSFMGMQNMGIYQNGFQGELYGKGTLDKENKNRIEFRAVTKNPIEFNSFTQYEEYFINYKRKDFFFSLRR